jgi:acetyl esterase
MKLPAAPRHQDKRMHFKGGLFALCLFLSMTVVAAAETHKNVEYSNVQGVSLQFDASIPEGSGPFPAVILVHGGGWVGGSRKIDVAPLFKPLADAGFAWFSVDYRLANSPLSFGVAVDDVAAAIRFIKSRAEEYRIDPTRIAVVGESAGGQLGAMAVLNEPGAKVKAVVAMYTPTDLVTLLKSSGLIPAQIRESLQGTPFEGLLVARLAQLSPIEKVSSDMPPFLMIHGTADNVVPFAQSRAMCSRMQEAGAPCELFKVPGAGHGMRRWEGDPAISEPYKLEMVRWLKEQLGAGGVRAL